MTAGGAHHAAADARHLHRGAVVTYLGYAAKLGLPVLTAFVTVAYGAER